MYEDIETVVRCLLGVTDSIQLIFICIDRFEIRQESPWNMIFSGNTVIWSEEESISVEARQNQCV